ncbi:hypothetical protein LCGC14_1215590 [marine sediment metagenome]|uniref:Sigma-70 family RNA polymerase sigma factor n=2 Tax=root TaxID=1 RepID=A0A831VNZ1_9FLAO|nr:sigma-70 family RNA polymerase sigma factor [Pricia sp.]HEA22275.1 sigma-70 family RNA polymerase sigma factor [Pricia antarctica]
MKTANTAVLEEMFLIHYQEWCLLSFSYLHNLDDAKDVVQNVVFKLLKKEDWDSIRDIKNYISKAIRNESLKKIKQNQRTYSLKNHNTEVPSCEIELIQNEISETIFKELELLPEQNKRVFKLCVLDGITYDNAAIIMGITVNTVKYHLKKSFKILRLNLRDVHF